MPGPAFAPAGSGVQRAGRKPQISTALPELRLAASHQLQSGQLLRCPDHPVTGAPAWQDFYNLVDVYLDAVLHPNCISDPRTFAQEGWHYEAENSQVNAAQELAPFCVIPAAQAERSQC